MFKQLKKTFDLTIIDQNTLSKLQTFCILFILFTIVGLFGIFFVKCVNPLIYEFLIAKELIFYAPILPINSTMELPAGEILLGVLFIFWISLSEELIFRLWITDDNIKLFIGLFLLFIASINYFGLAGIWILPLILIIYICKINKIPLYYFVILSSLIFGSYHYSNLGYFEFRSPLAFAFLPIINIGQTLGGILFAIARIKTGFFGAVLLHFIGNIIFITLFLQILN
jgi:Type II CAAX prenyl endopeptidase Rce1-like